MIKCRQASNKKNSESSKALLLVEVAMHIFSVQTEYTFKTLFFFQEKKRNKLKTRHLKFMKNEKIT